MSVLVYLGSLSDMYTVASKCLSGNDGNITNEDTHHSDFLFSIILLLRMLILLVFAAVLTSLSHHLLQELLLIG